VSVCNKVASSVGVTCFRTVALQIRLVESFIRDLCVVNFSNSQLYLERQDE
jgi:hypothetical protein